MAARKPKVLVNPAPPKPATQGFLFRVSDIRLGSEMEFSSLVSDAKIRFTVDAIRKRGTMRDQAYAYRPTDEVYLISDKGERRSLSASSLTRSSNWEMIA